MATAEKDRPRAAEKYVLDAVRAVGEKYRELNDDQRERALAAPERKRGLRGKALGRWIVDGEDLAAQEKRAGQERATKDASETAARRSAAAKNGGRSQYPDEVRAAVKRSNEIRGKSHGAGPKQHVAVRRVVAKETTGSVTGTPTKKQIVEASGAASIAELFAMASGEADREVLKKLRPLAEKMGDDPWCKGRHLAGALAAWTEEL